MMKAGSIFILIFSLLISSNTYGEGTWHILRNDDFVRNDGLEGDLCDVLCIDADQLWAVGSKGLMLHTNDGGKTWTQKGIEAETPVDFLRIYFRDAKVGFMTGTRPARWGVRAALFMTRDGGNTWTPKDPGVGSRLTGITMVDDKIGFLVGSDNTYVQTTDGGETWVGESERVRTGETRHNLWDVSFPSPAHGWVVGSFGSIYHTSDSGKTWEDQASGVDNNLRSVVFIDDKTGWIAGQEGIILHTNDGGVTWNQQGTDSYDNLNDICFVDKQNGWAVGDFGTVLHTTDGGQTWTREESGTSTTLLAIDALDPDHCCVVGEWGLILGYKR